MKIEVLYFDGCPNYSLAVDRIRDLLKEERIAAEISEVKVRDERTAQAIGFLGSPSIRINGVDAEAAARSAKDFGMMCRTYLEGGKRVGLPSRESIRAAIREVAQAPADNCCQPQIALTEPSGSVEPKRKWLFGASVAAAIAASLCCILPILTAVTGLGVLATGAKFEHWRPYFLGATCVLLAGGFFLAYRDHKRACEPGSVCATKPMSRWNFIALGAVAALVIGVAAFPYYSSAVTHALVGTPISNNTVGSGALATVTFQVPDMDCPACAVVLAATFQKLPGVTGAKLDADSRKAIVTYDPGSQNIAALEKVISDAGFHVASASRS